MNRRKIFAWLVSIAFMPIYLRATKSKKTKPKIGDSLVYAFGQKKGELIDPADVGSDLIFAFARDDEALVKVVRCIIRCPWSG